MTQFLRNTALCWMLALVASGCGESAADRAQREQMEKRNKAVQLQQVIDNSKKDGGQTPTPPAGAPVKPK